MLTNPFYFLVILLGLFAVPATGIEKTAHGEEQFSTRTANQDSSPSLIAKSQDSSRDHSAQQLETVTFVLNAITILLALVTGFLLVLGLHSHVRFQEQRSELIRSMDELRKDLNVRIVELKDEVSRFSVVSHEHREMLSIDGVSLADRFKHHNEQHEVMAAITRLYSQSVGVRNHAAISLVNLAMRDEVRWLAIPHFPRILESLKGTEIKMAIAIIEATNLMHCDKDMRLCLIKFYQSIPEFQPPYAEFSREYVAAIGRYSTYAEYREFLILIREHTSDETLRCIIGHAIWSAEGGTTLQ